MSGDEQSDKAAELLRYDSRAKALLASQDGGRATQFGEHGAAAFDATLRAPILFYEQSVRSVVQADTQVLELGAGTGVHTKVLVDTGADVTATDISANALAVLERNLGPAAGGRLHVRVADLEALAFSDASFDVVTCAGSLSYGDPATVDAGVLRILRPGGALIFLDTLNHNPVYRLNRWINYLRGRRTRSTLVRMPTLARIESIAAHFESAEVRYFGAVQWAMPVMVRFAGPERAASIGNRIDHLLRVKRSAFKFVLVARGKR